MAYRSGSFADVFFVVWEGAPRPSELAELEPAVEQMSQRLGRKILYLTVVRSEAPVPSAEERKALDAYARRLRRVIEGAYVVLEGQGFRASLQRSVVIGLSLWKDRGYTTICSTLDEAMARLVARSQADRDTLLAAARGCGLLA